MKENEQKGEIKRNTEKRKNKRSGKKDMRISKLKRGLG